MNDIKYISGVKPDGKRYAQFWATVKLYGLTSEECVAEIYERDGRFGFMVTPEAPDKVFGSLQYVLTNLQAGTLIRGTHTVTWKFGKPTFEEVTA